MRTAAEDVAAALAVWPVPVSSATPMTGGWNSSTWLVETPATETSATGTPAGETPAERYVAKLVDHLDAPGLVAGLRLADFASRRGLACGAPVRTTAGDYTVPFADGVLTLLTFVPGRHPDSTRAPDIRRAGRVLARAHQVLASYPAGDDDRYRWPWEWVPRCLDTIAMPAEINDAARVAWADIVQAVGDHELSILLLHADPGPEAFLLNADDPAQDAMIDWTTTLRGPLLYDVASFAVVTKDDGPQVTDWLIEGYLLERPALGAELADLGTMIRARWLANAIYFASRIERGITRGSDSPTANEDGLAAAFAGLTGTA